MIIQIPGNKEFVAKHLVLDFNGTIALDGKIIDGVKDRILELAKILKIHVLTADTNGSVARECEGLPVEVCIIGKEKQEKEKEKFILSLNSEGVISMGNGVNDELMFEVSELAIAVIGREGCAVTSLMKADIVVQHISDGLDLLLKQHRLIATLRK
ncbi:ATPase P [Vulcanibacillus modesticaldus]|uniref:ATPase P n=1 Tax=Vulcanibacillus modesticaldus TaxID=337097 RepID=A0A1D2YT10_9BACI|nr:HAD family hydrolase [Vulcanibacillus modesticaldus]OEF98809.1 ATPase P [Vulcanibacillus modesticaldus]